MKVVRLNSGASQNLLFILSFFLSSSQRQERDERRVTTIELFFVLLLFSDPFLSSIRKTKKHFCSFLGVFLLLSVPSR